MFEQGEQWKFGLQLNAKYGQGTSIMLEEFARTQIAAEEMHEAELKKMLRDNF